MAKKRIPQKVKGEIQAYIQILTKDHIPIEKVVLFGSYAKGTSNKYSDIDLCIISPKFKDPWKALQYLWAKRQTDEGLTIEPVGFSPQDFKDESPLIQEIKRTGIEV